MLLSERIRQHVIDIDRKTVGREAEFPGAEKWRDELEEMRVEAEYLESTLPFEKKNALQSHLYALIAGLDRMSEEEIEEYLEMTIEGLDE